MKFTFVCLVAALCLPAWAETENGDEALIAAAEKLIAEGNEAGSKNASTAADAAKDGATAAASSEAVTTSPTTTPTELKESEIPVVMSSARTEKAETSLYWRLVGSLAILAIFAGGMFYASKRWARKKDKGGNKARIEILHQLHMGPKKSLALIRVSGETILVGITDHNINMIKPVTLIDDELEGLLGKNNFNGFLEDEFSIEDVRTAISPHT